MKKYGPAVPESVNDANTLAEARKILADKKRVKAAARTEAMRVKPKRTVKKTVTRKRGK